MKKPKKKEIQHSLNAKRQRKIDHLREYKAQNGKAKAREKALHHMKMKPEDIQIAFDGSIY